MTNKDYYSVLGIQKDATQQDIKAAFRKLSLQYHPDRNQGNKEAEEKFKEINEANQALSDPAKRSEYDRGPANSDIFDNDISSRFGDVLRNFGIDFNFSDFAQAPKQNNITQFRINLFIDLKEAVFGCTKECTVPSFIKCGECNGDGGKLSKCDDCNGIGKSVQVLGTMRFAHSCMKCTGTGTRLTSHCKACNGQGSKKQTKKLSVKIQPGIPNGQILRLSAKDELADIFICVNVSPHPNIVRNGPTLLSTIQVSCLDALIGGSKKVDLIDGDTRLDIPSGIQHGQSLTIAGRGGVNPDGTRGDHVVIVELSVPTDLKSEHIEAIRTIRQELKQ